MTNSQWSGSLSGFPACAARQRPRVRQRPSTLAETLDAAPAEHATLLLTKLALLLAQELGNPQRFAELAKTALRDL